MKRVRKFVVDGELCGRRVRDDLLNAVPVGKIIALGRSWTGQLKPKVDALVETIGQLTTPFTVGRLLRAEELRGVTDLGRTWSSSLLSEIRGAAVASPEPGKPAAAGVIPVESVVDLTALLTATEKLHRGLIGGATTSVAITDRLNDIRRAASAIDVGLRTGDAANPHAVTAQSRRFIESLNEQAREFHKKRENPPTTRAIGDSSGRDLPAARDAHAAVLLAKTLAERHEAVRALQAACWSSAS